MTFKNLVVEEVSLVEEILKSMAYSQLILESTPLSKPPLLPSPYELLPILPVPQLLNPTLHLSLKAPKICSTASVNRSMLIDY